MNKKERNLNPNKLFLEWCDLEENLKEHLKKHGTKYLAGAGTLTAAGLAAKKYWGGEEAQEKPMESKSYT